MRVMILAVLLQSTVFAQNFEVDTQELLDVVKKWNYANNARSAETFSEIYSDRLTYYTEDITKGRCISLKQSYFASHPDYKQKIVSDPSFTPLTSGVIKSDFVREIYQNGKWKKVPTYLLITYERGKYFITGESDLTTDKRLKYKPQLGKPMDLPQSETKNPVAEGDFASKEKSQRVMDTTTAVKSDSINDESLYAPDSITASAADTSSSASKDTTSLTSVQEEVLSDEPVLVPKKYIYFLIGFLLFTAVIVLLWRPRSPKRKVFSGREATVDRETTLVRSDKSFSSHLVSLFDPLYFVVRTRSRQQVPAGNVTRTSEFHPDLEVEFRNKDTHVRLAVECIYVPQLASRELLAFSSNQISRYHEFEEDRGAEVYLIVGIEGTASEPNEIYLIPAIDLREGHLSYAEVKPYRKYGMFFYNSVRRRLL